MKVAFRAGSLAGQEFEVDGTLVVGRQDADLELEDTAVSRKHAVLRPSEEGIELEDLGSTNGTFVNGEQISGTRSLKSGDFVNIGNSTFEVTGDWRSAETEAISLPSEGAHSPSTEDEERKPTEPIGIGSPGSRPWSNISKPWLIAGAVVLAVVALTVINVSRSSGDGDLVADGNALCRNVGKQVQGTRLVPGNVGRLRESAAELLGRRRDLRVRMGKLENKEERDSAFATYLQRFEETNGLLEGVTKLESKAGGAMVRDRLDRLKVAANSESRSATAVGFEACTNLPPL
jgi:hypothetical protein